MPAIDHVVLVGHCGFDGGALRRAVAAVLPGVAIAHADDRDTLLRLATPRALLLVNRVLDHGFDTASGVDLIRTLAAGPTPPRCLLISNYDDAQQAATAAGALPGFGKSDLGHPLATQRLQAAAQ